jgi:predicted alpha/beta-hydrolase family hydrolase
MAAATKPEIAPLERDGVRGFLHTPKENAGRSLVLTHGAGGNCASPLLVKTAIAFCSAGVTVLRCDLPFRQRRPSGPPSPANAAADRAGLRAAAALLTELAPGDIVLAGLSYGGRQASMLAAEEPELASALLLLSYPLHPPGKPDRLRVQHFPRLETTAVFVHGAADPFGSLQEMKLAVAMILAPTRLIAIANAGHSLGGQRFDPAETVAAVTSIARRGPRALSP